MEEDDDVKKNHNAVITKENNTVKVNVNINVSSINATKKSMADVNAKSKAELEKDKQAQSYLLLDTLFSYIGTTDEATATQKLNLFSSLSQSSRASAGTTVKMPGDIKVEKTSMTNNSFYNSGRGNLPDLLPVSCGYFFNIVR